MKDILHKVLHFEDNFFKNFSGLHTQYVEHIKYMLPFIHNSIDGFILISCSQIIMLDIDLNIVRVLNISNLKSVIQFKKTETEKEIFLTFDNEPDIFMTGVMISAGNPEKEFIPLINSLYNSLKTNRQLEIEDNILYSIKDKIFLASNSSNIYPEPLLLNNYENCSCWGWNENKISKKELNQRITNIFSIHNPDLLHIVPHICNEYNIQPCRLIRLITSLYGYEPTAEEATSNNDKSNNISNKISNSSINKITFDNNVKYISNKESLSISQFLLSMYPSGGMNSIDIMVEPIGHLIKEGKSQIFKRNEFPDQEFWYLCEDRYLVCFDISNASLLHQFGYSHGDRMLSMDGPIKGNWCTVIGVINNCLWVHEDKSEGAIALIGCNNRKDCEELCKWSQLDKVEVPEPDILPFTTLDGNQIYLKISPEELKPFDSLYYGMQFIKDPTINNASMNSFIRDLNINQFSIAGTDIEKKYIYAQFKCTLSLQQIEAIIKENMTHINSFYDNMKPYKQGELFVIPLINVQSVENIRKSYGFISTNNSSKVICNRKYIHN